jgi:elongator complex protein 1
MFAHTRLTLSFIYRKSLVSATGKEPSLRVWEREDLAFHATGESLRPQRISSGDLLFGGFEAGDESDETKSEDATRRRLPYSPPLAWQPRGALIAVATVAQNERDDVDSDDTSASESDGGAAPEKKGKENPTKPSKLTPTAASIIFYERNGLRRGEFTLPKFAVSGTTVTSIAWSSDSRRLAVCVCDPEGARASFFPSAGSGGGGEKKSDSRRRDGDGKHQHRDAAHGSAVQIWRRGNGRWYLSKQICFATCEGEKVSCTWDAVAADTLRTCTPSGLIETHVFCDEVCVSSTGTVAVIDGAAVLVTPLAKTVIPPPMAAATVTFPNSVQDVCFSPGRCIGGCVECDSFRDTNNGRLSTHTHARTLAGEHVLALLSDGRLAICSARLHTEWEETAETLMDEDDECEFKSRDFFATDDDVLLVGKIVNPVSGSHNLLEHPGDVARRVAWIDFDTVLLTTERPSDGSCSLVSIKLTKQTVGASAGLSKLAARDAGWHCEVVAVVDLPGCANAIAVAEGEPVACAFVQLQNRGQVSGDSSLNARTEKNDASANSNNVLLASAEVDTNGDFVLEVLPVTWPSGALSTSCVALKALPPVQKGGPPALCGLDGKGTLFCGEKILANEIRSFTTHFGATGTGKQSGDLSMDDSVAAAAANALAWRLWSLGDTPTGNTPTPPPARVVYVTESDELRVFELFEIFDRGDVLAPLDSPFGAQNVDPNFTNNYATAAGGTREGTDNSNDIRAGGHQQNIERKLQQNDAMHVAMRAAMRPRDAGREIDSRTRRVEQGAVLVVAPSGGVELVLQMPRGNLECVAPRFLVLPAVASAVDADDFALATRYVFPNHHISPP